LSTSTARHPELYAEAKLIVLDRVYIEPSNLDVPLCTHSAYEFVRVAFVPAIGAPLIARVLAVVTVEAPTNAIVGAWMTKDL
jgi:hypothetical protein